MGRKENLSERTHHFQAQASRSSHPGDVLHVGHGVVVAHGGVGCGEASAGTRLLRRLHEDRLLDLQTPVRWLQFHSRDHPSGERQRSGYKQEHCHLEHARSLKGLQARGSKCAFRSVCSTTIPSTPKGQLQHIRVQHHRKQTYLKYLLRQASLVQQVQLQAQKRAVPNCPPQGLGKGTNHARYSYCLSYWWCTTLATRRDVQERPSSWQFLTLM